MNTTVDRIYKIAEYKHDSIYKLSKGIGVSNGYFSKQRQNNGAISSNIIEKIVIYYPDVDANWLLTGEGEMLKKQEKTAVNQSILGNNNKNNQLAGGNINSHFQSEIADLKKQLAEKDKIINNLIKQQEKLINKLTQQ
jgi:hypothetical protein